MHVTVLSINLNKVALLRNSRGGALPDLQEAARVALAAGAGGITLHPRPDQRHARPHDVTGLKAWLPVELNLEGNPWSGPNDAGYPGFLALVERARPAQCTLVPDADGQLTSDHGFDFERDAARLRPVVAQLKAWGCRVSLFCDADAPQLERAAELGADRIEIYTGPYAHAHAAGDDAAALAACVRTAERAQRAGLGVNAGHDLDQRNLAPFLRAMPQVLEVSIGHALVSEALYDGLAVTVRRYLAAIASSRG